MTTTTTPTAPETAAALALVDRLFGPLDDATRRSGAVLEAYWAALTWVEETTGRTTVPRPVATTLNDTAAGLDEVTDERDPREVLFAVAAEALGAYMAPPS